MSEGKLDLLCGMIQCYIMVCKLQSTPNIRSMLRQGGLGMWKFFNLVTFQMLKTDTRF